MEEHIKLTEFVCKCGECKHIALEMVQKTIKLKDQLNVIRKRLHKPMHINSGVRCEKHNKKVGGVSNSRHIVGDAADLRVEGMTGLELKGYFQALIDVGEIEDGGLGTYPDRPNILHYDLGPPRRWDK